jgi:hypothetical protein
MLVGFNEKKTEPTIPDDINDPSRFGQPTETTKDAFILEIRKFFNRQYQTSSIIEEIPTIRKYDISHNPNETSQETAVNLIQKYPDINENLPLVAVLGVTGRNLPMGIGGQYVCVVRNPPIVEGSIQEPFVLTVGQTISFETIDKDGTTRISTTTLRGSRFTNIVQATAKEVIDEINFQSQYARGYMHNGKVQIGYGGPETNNINGTIKIVGGTALSALGFTVGQQQTYTDVIPYHRYHQATTIDIGMEVVAEDHNIRTELTDLIESFFAYFLDSRTFTFYGRSTFNQDITNEHYQVIINNSSLAMSGEQEIPRPGDEKDKLYVNRVNVTVTTIQFSDKAVLVPGTSTPFYIGENSVVVDDTIPPKQ